MYNSVIAHPLREAALYTRYQFELAVFISHKADYETFEAQHNEQAMLNSQELMNWWEKSLYQSEDKLSCTEIRMLAEEVQYDWRTKKDVASFKAIYQWRIQESTRNMRRYNDSI